MALSLGPFQKIVDDFSSSVKQIFGLGSTKGNAKGELAKNDGKDVALFSPKLGGAQEYQKSNWIGNAGSNKNKVRYGFAILNAAKIVGKSLPKGNVYYLDIPPQAISQKEIFATNISATRKGVIVESEGVVFKDIVIQGTTGIMPGPRGSSNSPQANFSDFTAAPKGPAGVKIEDGKSTSQSTSTLSGYEEFIRLRQFFLRYAKEKVDSDGDRFLIFVNEKDSQTLIVEPLEFVMERNSKSPMTYNYRIVLKAIGTLDAALTGSSGSKASPADFLTKAANVAANSSAAIKQARATLAAGTQTLSRFSQALDQTFLDPLRQVQFAMEDIADGTATVLSLPAILIRNAKASVLDIRDSADSIGNSVNNFSLGSSTGSGGQSGSSSTSTSSSSLSAQNATSGSSAALTSGQFNESREVLNKIQTDNRVPLPRSFVTNVAAQARHLAEDLADSLNLGDTNYDMIVRRVSTQTPNPLKVASDDELLLLGSLLSVQVSLQAVLATNGMFQSDAQSAFDDAAAPFDGNITLVAPTAVREIMIEEGEILERIAQREYGDAARWVDIVVLNNLKPPYIDTVRQDGVKIPGDKLLIGAE
jgi:hypothetical protein